ncbi:hypothetical protein E2C01_014535 [Portunus trituberculatus]|uniref:Uncharacterized protein n=1 Tax=Portunus trituberculatus TaxID=210409 RepID=A0A5B7DKC1_PORTR|nr:hypothetical protein [Portunus trituberculatus]
MPLDLKICRDCKGRFAKQYYEDYFSRPFCRFLEPTLAHARPSPRILPSYQLEMEQGMRRTHLPLTTCNRFSILSEQVEEAQETRLVEDSIVRGQLEEFCGRVLSRRRRYCLPGATLRDITDCVEDVTKEATNDTLCHPRRYK